MTTMGPLRTTQNTQPPVPEVVPGFVMTRSAMAIIVMFVAAVVGGIGAWGAWGWGQGLFTFAVMMAVYGIFLGIGS